MKIRTDFVTNSSSSSFVLVFDNKDSVLEFKERCWDYGYEPLLDLIKNLWCDSISIMTDEKPVKTEKIIEKIYANTKCLPFIETDERIKNAYAVISGMIWDTNGGLLEYAIRNELLPTEFGDFCVMSENVG